MLIQSHNAQHYTLLTSHLDNLCENQLTNTNTSEKVFLEFISDKTCKVIIILLIPDTAALPYHQNYDFPQLPVQELLLSHLLRDFSSPYARDIVHWLVLHPPENSVKVRALN